MRKHQKDANQNPEINEWKKNENKRKKNKSVIVAFLYKLYWFSKREAIEGTPICFKSHGIFYPTKQQKHLKA